jgi:predicted MPP superfamily phosphohydrolase
MIFFAIFFTLFLLVDKYVYQAIQTVTAELSPVLRHVIRYLYWTFTFLLIAALVVAILTRGPAPNNMVMALFSIFLILFVSKVAAALFLLLDDTRRLGKLVTHKLFRRPAARAYSKEVNLSRSKFLSQLALLAGAIPFATMVWGMAQGAYSYRVKRVPLRLPNLPAAFDGYRLLHISDLHTGSFRSTSPLYRAVDLINQQQADLVVFTGDLVNYVAGEVLDHMPALRQIQARAGVYSVLGNHDYGDYVEWGKDLDKTENFQRLLQAHRELGWNLLRNENQVIEKDGDRIAVIGVENWSQLDRFPRYGDIQKAHAGTEEVPFKVLLSHDPSHWAGQITGQFPDIDLTLSGHTHGMQFGVNLPDLKWSPIQYLYEHWAGLYQKGQQYLYVNTGLGFLGYPGRVGFLPEITVFELRKA